MGAGIAVAALLPMSLHLAASFSRDAPLLGLCFAFTALLMDAAFDPEKRKALSPARLAALLLSLGEDGIRRTLKRLRCSNACIEETAVLVREARGRDGSFSEDRPLGWDPVAEGNRAGDGMACNNSDRRLRRKQGTAVGAAASKMRAVAKQMLGAATRISCPRRKLPTRQFM